MSSFRRAGVPRSAVPAPGGAPAALAAATSPTPPPTAPASSTPLGTRRWLNGALLVSTGLPALDAALGGGVPLGALVLIEEDLRLNAACRGAGHGKGVIGSPSTGAGLHAAPTAAALAALFAAEGVAARQRVRLGGADGRSPRAADFLRALPLNASEGSADLAALGALGAGGEGERGGSGESESGEGERGGSGGAESARWDTRGDGLRIAWQ
jgi:hypothetical protein